MNLNKAIIIGNLTRDPELKSLPSGVTLATLGIATNRTWRDKDGNKQDDTEFHNVVVFGRQAETSAQYLKKGQSALVEGRLQTRSWEGQDGVKRYRTEIIADRVQFGPKSGGNGGGYSGGGGASTGSQAEPPTVEYPEESINPDDIPF